MALPLEDTVVTYPDGATTSTGVVVHTTIGEDGRTVVLLDRTAFHPVDTAWPDQPSDVGSMTFGAETVRIASAVTGGIHDGELHLGADLPVRTGTDGWVFVVGHVLDGPAPAVGATVEVDVDADLRRALSVGHTACHLASLALDAALADAWSKPVPHDALGFPAFDQLAIETSRIGGFASTDVFRVGKSLRKRGFDPAALDDAADLRRRVDARLAEWIAQDATVAIERADDRLTARRTWVCRLADGEARIPCGGTHVTSLGELGRVSVAFETAPVPGGLGLTMRTTVTPAAG